MTKREKRVRLDSYDSTTGHSIRDKVNASRSKAVMQKERGQTRATMVGKGNIKDV